MSDDLIHAVVRVNPDLTCDIIKTFDDTENAIHFLTNYINDQYDLKDTQLYKVYQKSSQSFEVFKLGYLYKSLECKYHVVQIEY